jgi:hypothetical protein
MTPTPKLRFVERIVQFQIEPMSNTTIGKTVRILQQWWDNDIPGWKAPGEWRDVPLEVEA